jgi:hypothetical protein
MLSNISLLIKKKVKIHIDINGDNIYFHKIIIDKQ